MVELQTLVNDEDVEEVKDLITRHLRYTGSKVAERVLINWEKLQPKFWKVMPTDYERALKAMKRAAVEGISW
jgi:glutamate synthase (ferredoxin)